MRILTALALSAVVVAQSKHPTYDRCANFKVGSWVKMKIEAESGGVKGVEDRTVTLTELTKEKAILEWKRIRILAERKYPEETSRIEIRSDNWPNPTTVQKEGEEEIEIAGKKLKCRWIKGTSNEGNVKFWVSTEVPGGIVKVEQTTSEGVTTKSIVTGWEKKE